jgi:formylmethanofuran dehydrogenase subunit E
LSRPCRLPTISAERNFQTLQWDYARRLTSQPLGESFIVEDAADYLWPAPPCKDLGRRRDNDYKDVPETP